MVEDRLKAVEKVKIHSKTNTAVAEFSARNLSSADATIITDLSRTELVKEAINKGQIKSVVTILKR